MSSYDGRTGQVWTRWQRARNTLAYWAIRAALAVADRIAPERLVSLGRAAGALAYFVLPALRRAALDNLQRALPDVDPRRVARRCFAHAGQNLALSVLLRRPGLRALDLVYVSPDSRALLETTLRPGHGAVIVSAHLGPFELLAAAVAELGFAPAVVVRESYDVRLDPLVDQHRVGRTVEVIHRGHPGAAARIVRALRAGRPVGMLADLAGRMRSAPGVLLGQSIELPVGPGRIATRASCPVLVGTLEPAVRTDPAPGRWPGDNLPRFVLRLSRIEASDEIALTRNIADTLSDRIRSAADHWLWMAPRFRLLRVDPA